MTDSHQPIGSQEHQHLQFTLDIARINHPLYGVVLMEAGNTSGMAQTAEYSGGNLGCPILPLLQPFTPPSAVATLGDGEFHKQLSFVLQR